MNWILVVLIWSIPNGHGLADASYRDRVELGPFQTEADCLRAIPHVRFDSFPRTDDLSYDMHQVMCVKAPEPKHGN